MKTIKYLLLSFLIHTGVVIAGGDFTWTDKGDSKVLLGARIQLLKTWGTQLLVIQCAMKNESMEVRFVPVVYSDMHLRLPTVEYWLSAGLEGGDPFSPLKVQIAPGGMMRLSAVVEPRRYIRLGPGETFQFSPVTVDMGNAPEWKQMSVTTRLKIDAPSAGYDTIEVTKSASQLFEDSAKIVPQKVAVGEWAVEIPYDKKN